MFVSIAKIQTASTSNIPYPLSIIKNKSVKYFCVNALCRLPILDCIY